MQLPGCRIPGRISETVHCFLQPPQSIPAERMEAAPPAQVELAWCNKLKFEGLPSIQTPDSFLLKTKMFRCDSLFIRTDSLICVDLFSVFPFVYLVPT